MFLGNKIRVEILLPLFDNHGNPIDKVKSKWIDEEEREYSDTNCGFYVLASHTDKSTNFFMDYKETLKKRFSQADILITYYPVETL